MKTLIFHSLETLSAKKLALDLSGEVELRKNHYRIHTKKDFDIENYRRGRNIIITLMLQRKKLKILKEAGFFLIYMVTDKIQMAFMI